MTSHQRLAALEDKVNALVKVQADFQAETTSQINAILRQISEAAIREARLAVDLTAKDAFSGPVAVENLAAVYALVDRTDDALQQIERLLAMDYLNSLTDHRLRYEFQWDPLRDDPRFKRLIEEHS